MENQTRTEHTRFFENVLGVLARAQFWRVRESKMLLREVRRSSQKSIQKSTYSFYQFFNDFDDEKFD